MNILVSSCLMGENCKYNGGNNRNDELIGLLKDHNIISVCPEVLGGLSAPRPPAEIINGRVMDKNGNDLTEAFRKGAKEVVDAAIKYDCAAAVMKSRSPSCGKDVIYDGSFSGKLINGDGVTAQALSDAGIPVFTEEDVSGAFQRFLNLAPIYNLPANEAAPALLGKLLCRKIGESIQKLRITETEAYCGEEDTACHAHRGKTKRNEVLYREPGTAYVYLCYGIHSLLNVVTMPKGVPHAVLIRGVEGFSGPGKLTKALDINLSLNGENLITSDRLWIEDDGTNFDYKTTPRVGIDYATPKYRDINWRFVAI